MESTVHGKTNSIIKSPIVITPARSSFNIQIGAGPQTQVLKLFPSTSLPELYLIHPNGCLKAGNKTFNGLSCESSRGGLYNHNISTTYVAQSTYDFRTYATFRNFEFPRASGQVGFDSI